MNNKEKAKEMAAQKQMPAKKIRFKAGSELSEKVNKANIIIDDFSDDNEFKIKVKIDFSNDEGETITFQTGSNRPRFKAGADLTEKVNINFNNEIMEIVLDKVDFKTTDGTTLKAQKPKKKTRFKAGADLTDKVNQMEVDYIEEIDEDNINVRIDIKTW
jgi:hypothetical protein